MVHSFEDFEQTIPKKITKIKLSKIFGWKSLKKSISLSSVEIDDRTTLFVAVIMVWNIYLIISYQSLCILRHGKPCIVKCNS